MEDFSVASIDPTLLDLKAWPGVNSGVLSEAKRIKFEKRNGVAPRMRMVLPLECVSLDGRVLRR